MEASAPAAGSSGAVPTSEPQTQGTEPAQKGEARYLTAKVDGKEVRLSEEQVIRDYQKYAAADQRFREAAAMKKQAEEERARAADRKARAKAEPWKLLQEDLELDDQTLDDLAEKRLLKKLELEMMNPDQKRAWKAEQDRDRLQKEIDARKAGEDEERSKLEQQRQEELTLEAVKHVDQEIGEALKGSGIAADPEIVAYMADVMLAHLEKGGEPLSAPRALELVTQKLQHRTVQFLASLPIEKLYEILPKQVLDGLRKYELAKVKGQSPVPRTQTRAMSTPQRAKAGKTSTDDFFSRLESKIR